MRTIGITALAAIVLMGSAVVAADKPKDLIVGKWEPVTATDESFVIEFTKGGAIKVTAKDGVEIKGKYKFTGDDAVEIDLDVMGDARTEKIKIVKITKDNMTTVDEQKKEVVLKRVK